MKKIFFVLALSLSFGVLATAQQNDTKEEKTSATQEGTKIGPKLEFEAEKIDFGTIVQESDPYRTLKFKNVGDEPLLITNARGSCGCTVPTVPKKPIQPGETAEIKVRYDTKRIGTINKTVTLTTNEPTKTKTIRVVGKVTAKPEGTPTKESNPFNNNN